MDLLEIARQSGMQELLDAQIGPQMYHSVCGSLASLERFAAAATAAALQPPQPEEPFVDLEN
ncbi:hypothetical protein [Paraburkholderia phosphatilytica]|uniref:hypothetical protein n=1 Tax=Paraburkholderia phosphatilytica TaxID=2282883 RepID=UPI000E4F2F1D|nr:hypothetical protein [Paraburkholderia phosphatilytica]